MLLNADEEEYANKVLLCLYPNDEIENFKKQLTQLNDCIVPYANLDSRITFIQSNEKKKILSHSYICEVLSHLDIFSRIDWIFIDCLKQDEFKYIYDDQLNPIGVYARLDLLCSSTEERIDLTDKQSYK